ncbi:hypothetical protein [Cryobacterium sp. TMT1-21]|nr:hypothetical protein [Cryobacterium sp. TMT1-21]
MPASQRMGPRLHRTGTGTRIRHRTGQVGLITVLSVIAGLGLVGCSATSPGPTSARTSAPSATPSENATPSPSAAPVAAPVLRPELDAAANLDYFDAVAAAVVAADSGAGGRAFIDALARGGFDKAQMSVTFDDTSAELAADSIQFAVRMGEECLIGQNGPATGGYHGAVLPVLGSGTCLVGVTRQIDW